MRSPEGPVRSPPPWVPAPSQKASLLVLVTVTSISHKVVIHIPLGTGAGVHDQGRGTQKPSTHPSSRAKVLLTPRNTPSGSLTRLQSC